MDELERIRKQNRRLFVVVSFLILLTLLGLGLNYFREPSTTVKNYAGKDGRPGMDAAVDYAQIFAVIDNKFAALPTPRDGRDGRDGKDSTVPGPMGPASIVPGPKGEDSTIPGPKGEDSTVPGPKGEAGPPGRSPEFQCEPETHNYQWRYVGDDSWQTLQPNSKACTENE